MLSLEWAHCIRPSPHSASTTPPDLDPGGLPPEVIEVKPTTPAGRIDGWQKKLLDLTLRNRLLNFPESKKTIPFLCTDVGFLEDRLAEGAAISLPEQNPLGQRDASLFREVHGRDLQRDFAAEALARDELASPLDAKTLEARLIDLDRQVRNDFAEGGANTLFLAVGFLRWKKKAEDERIYRAPLLLLPVKLERRSASSVRMDRALNLVQITEWSSRWQDEFLATSRRLREALAAFEEAVAMFETALGLSRSRDMAGDRLEALVALAHAVAQSEGHDIRIAFDDDLERMRPAIARLGEATARYASARLTLSARYDEGALRRLDIDDLER